MILLALAVCWPLSAARAAGAPGALAAGRQLVAGAENALWDDHVDVRDPCFILARDGIDPDELTAELRRVADDAAQPDELRARARRLLGRLAPGGHARCRSGEGREAPPPAWRRPG